MKNIVKLTESDLDRLVKRIIKEELGEFDWVGETLSYDGILFKVSKTDDDQIYFIKDDGGFNIDACWEIMDFDGKTVDCVSYQRTVVGGFFRNGDWVMVNP